MDLRGSIPSFIHISDGKLHDVNVLDLLLPEAGAYYVMDRGYLDFERLFRLHQALAFFITRARRRFNFRRRYSLPTDKSTGIQCDQAIVLSSFYPAKKYPEPLRRIRYRNPETGDRLVFLTNNFELPASVIASLYKARWRIELFFKWIKQHLRIKVFYGTSGNAVKTQIWIAISTYLLVAILKRKLHVEQSLYTILQVLSVSLFEKTPILQALSGFDSQNHDTSCGKQLILFD